MSFLNLQSGLLFFIKSEGWGGDEAAGFPPEGFPVYRYEDAHAKEIRFTPSQAD